MKHTERKKPKIISLAKKDDFGRRLIEVGEIVPLMVKKMNEGLAACMQKNMHRRKPYWILYTADWYRNGEELQDTFSPREVRPPRMLNTICWWIDNVAGRIENLWVLPKDAPTGIIEGSGNYDETLAKSSQGIPILY